jgi:hypothetical protein
VNERTGSIVWRWGGNEVRIGYTQMASGPLILLLPAMSSISTRRETRPLQERLARHYCATSIDWPGFGDIARPPVKWSPQAYAAFLQHVLTDLFPRAIATVAAGHATSYVLAAANASPGATGVLCLIAPTWRGPLPTVMGRPSRLADFIVRLGDLRLLGALLYRLNVNVPVVRMMARGHVYADANWLSGARLDEKMAVVNAPGARCASSPASWT